jgi:hypothetical protein
MKPYRCLPDTYQSPWRVSLVRSATEFILGLMTPYCLEVGSWERAGCIYLKGGRQMLRGLEHMRAPAELSCLC